MCLLTEEAFLAKLLGVTELRVVWLICHFVSSLEVELAATCSEVSELMRTISAYVVPFCQLTA